MGKNDGRYDISSAFFGRWNLELGREREEERKEGRTGGLLILLESRQPKFDSPVAAEFRMNGSRPGKRAYPGNGTPIWQKATSLVEVL